METFESEVMNLVTRLNGRRVLALSGAGMSTDSGIPDYRGPRTIKTPRNPIRYQQFMKRPEARQRYWARSLVGWPFIARAEPNAGHHALATLEAQGSVQALLTQNVDGLHQAAGNKRVLDLHGNLGRVICLACGQVEPRVRFQRRMLHLNPDFEARRVELAPDGDAEVPEALIDDFELPTCLRCRGVMKPDVVFFGENVPKDRVEQAWRWFDACDTLLVLGSSLTVFSGYRFAARALKQAKPVIIINLGPTRADEDAQLKIDASLSDFLPELARQLK